MDLSQVNRLEYNGVAIRKSLHIRFSQQKAFNGLGDWVLSRVEIKKKMFRGVDRLNSHLSSFLALLFLLFHFQILECI